MTTIPSDETLQRALAAELPELIDYAPPFESNNGTIPEECLWLDSGAAVTLREWREVVTLCVVKLTENEQGDYRNHLCNVCANTNDGPGSAMAKAFFATWQHQAVAYFAVKGKPL